MRSAIVAAAFAAGALAVPLVERAVVYETNVVYATEYVTVTQGELAATTVEASTADAPAASSTSSKKIHNHGKPHGYTSAWTSSWATTWTSESAPAASSAQEEAPAYTSTSVQEQASVYSTPESTYEAPQSTYVASSTSEAASSQAASSASQAKPTDYQSIVTYHHNIHRSNHSADALAWNDTLAASAQKIGETCSYEHMMTMDGGGYGQNIAAGVKGDNVSAVITELFYNGEERAYADAGNYGKSGSAFDNSNFHVWGHMTQIVWTNTTTVGCATVDCSATGLANTGGNVAPYFTVCNYYPPGNYEGEYANSVLAPRGDATCSWDDGL